MTSVRGQSNGSKGGENMDAPNSDSLGELSVPLHPDLRNDLQNKHLASEENGNDRRQLSSKQKKKTLSSKDAPAKSQQSKSASTQLTLENYFKKKNGKNNKILTPETIPQNEKNCDKSDVITDTKDSSKRIKPQSVNAESSPKMQNDDSNTDESSIIEMNKVNIGFDGENINEEILLNRRHRLRRNASRIAAAALRSTDLGFYAESGDKEEEYKGEDEEDEEDEEVEESAGGEIDAEHLEKPKSRKKRKLKASDNNNVSTKTLSTKEVKPKKRKNSKAVLDIEKFFEEDIIHNVSESIINNTNAQAYAGAIKSKHRIQFLFGHNRNMLLDLYRNNLKWRNMLFHIDKSQILEDITENLAGLYQINHKQLHSFSLPSPNDENSEGVEKQEYEVLSEGEYHELYHEFDNTLKFRSSEDNDWISLSSDEFFLDQKGRSKLVLNFNGVITDMQWLNNLSFDFKDSFNYLFLGMVSHKYKITDQELSTFNTKYEDDFISFLKIYKFDHKLLTIDIDQVWAFKGIGHIKEIKFAYARADRQGSDKLRTVVGLLFGDGILRFYKYDNERQDNEKYKLMQTPYREVKMPLPHYISAFEFLDDQRVVVGTQLGYLSEFDLLHPKKPIYFVRKHFGAIWRIVLERPINGKKPSYLEDTLIHTISADHTIKFCLRRDIAAASVNLPTRRFMFETSFFEYLPFINCVIYGNINEGRCYTSRNVKAVMNLVVKHTQHSTALSLDASYLHPFLISGSSSGEVIIKNYICEYFRKKKPSKKAVLDTGFLRQYQISPLKFEYNAKLKGFKINSSVNLRDTKTFGSEAATLASNYKKQVVKDNSCSEIDIKRDNILFMRSDEPYVTPQKPIIYPVQLLVSKVKWCDTVASYPWYGVALVEDLLVIDCMNHSV